MKCLTYTFTSIENKNRKIQIARLVDSYDFEADYAWGKEYGKQLLGYDDEPEIAGVIFVDDRDQGHS